MNCINMQFQTNSGFYVFLLNICKVVMNCKKKKPFSYSFQR